MNQLSLLPNNQGPGDAVLIHKDCYLLPGAISLSHQQSLLAKLRGWIAQAGGMWTPTMKDGRPMNHPLCGLGLQWKPYEYFPSSCPMPDDLVGLARRLLCDERLYAIAGSTLRDRYIDFTPDAAIINWFPVGSSLRDHQDRSEHPSTIAAGMPIVTIAIGCSCDLRVGGLWRQNSMGPEHQMHSGDVFIMHGESRSRFHEVRRIYPVLPIGLDMKEGRISITMRRVKPLDA